MKQADKTHCPRGHEYTKENTYKHNGGSRQCRACRLAHVRKVSAQNKIAGIVFPSHTPEAKKEGHLKPIGWTLEMFNSTLDVQNSKCLICDKPVNLDKVQNESRACADHVHSVPPIPRGVLCTTCNAGLGHFKDNPSFLRQAAAYLECITNNDDVSAFVRGKRDIWQQV